MASAEVALDKPYNASCDVYSFAIMFWEMYALKKAFARHTADVFIRFVIQGDSRPAVPDSWPTPMKLMLNRCWSKQLAERLSMTEIAAILKKEISSMRGGDDWVLVLDHARRRSTFVYCKPTSLTQ